MKIAVGQPCPYPGPDNDEGGFAFFAGHGPLTGVLRFPGENTAERRAWERAIQLFAFYTGPAYPWGILSVLLTDDDNRPWPLLAPIARVTPAWSNETDIMLLVLVDHATDRVQSIRTVSMPKDLVTGIGRSLAVGYQFRLDEFAAMSHMPLAEIIQQSAVWIYKPRSQRFRRVEPATREAS